MCVCVCMYPYWEERGGKWNGGGWGGEGMCPSMVNGLAVMGKSWPRPKLACGVIGGDGVDSCVQVGAKTLARTGLAPSRPTCFEFCALIANFQHHFYFNFKLALDSMQSKTLI